MIARLEWLLLASLASSDWVSGDLFTESAF